MRFFLTLDLPIEIKIGNQSGPTTTENPLPKVLASVGSIIADAQKKAQADRGAVMNKIAAGLNHAVEPGAILARLEESNIQPGETKEMEVISSLPSILELPWKTMSGRT